ncbi:MAG TPA: type II toxin-antitoxin system VapC family toxin [Armatimonadota bacterium]|jgi:predicted nucleic acid-binding protein
MRIYVDTAPVIYVVERREPWAHAVDAWLAAPECTILSSALTRMECLVLPLREGNSALEAEYRRFFTDAVAEVSLSDVVLDLAAEIRATHGFRTPDAIHLAAAQTGGCDIFLTNDRRLAHYPGLAVEALGAAPS